MPEPTDPPAFGQVWRWHMAFGISTLSFILLNRVENESFDGAWMVLFIGILSPAIGEMVGLHDDPARRLREYERLD
jgi:hypothetical protein